MYVYALRQSVIKRGSDRNSMWVSSKNPTYDPYRSSYEYITNYLSLLFFFFNVVPDVHCCVQCDMMSLIYRKPN